MWKGCNIVLGSRPEAHLVFPTAGSLPGILKISGNHYFRTKLIPMVLLQASGGSDILIFLLVGVVLVLTFLFLRRKR